MFKDGLGDHGAPDSEELPTVPPIQIEKDPDINCSSLIVLLVFAVASVAWCIAMVASSRSTGSSGPGSVDMSHAHPSNYPRNR
ncbi:hypothetical protein Pan44_27490 [Caulifigura coniformis]|uniref:Uncharacterized protein n=2 Tax=Caulifigura coniformis TaxID=2527983 RepID=A0A517SF01_9PLAN|nr:hypothetical protein Pan44_27490 [Caulifigura coniformis]